MIILLVEPDEATASQVIAAFQERGHTVYAVTEFEVARRTVRALPDLDVLIVEAIDVSGDGFALRDELEEIYPSLRTVFMSPYDLSDYHERMGDCPLAARPVDPGRLVAMVEELPSAGHEWLPAGSPTPRPQPGENTIPPPPATTPLTPQREVETPAPEEAVPDSSLLVARPVPVTEDNLAAAAPADATGETTLPLQALPLQALPLQAFPVDTGDPVHVEAPQETAVEPETLEPPLPPDSWLGEYRLGAFLQGTRNTEVYEAVQTSIDRRVTLVRLKPHLAQDADEVSRFLNDARAKAAVKHKHIVPVYEALETGEEVFHTREYVAGESIGMRTARRAPLTDREALAVLKTTAQACFYLTTHKIPHRMVDSDSVFLKEDGPPVIGNLAVADALHQASQRVHIRRLAAVLRPLLPAGTGAATEIVESIERQYPKGIASWGALIQAIRLGEPEAGEADGLSDRPWGGEKGSGATRDRLPLMIASALGFGAILGAVLYFVLRHEQINPDGVGPRVAVRMVAVPAGDFVFQNGSRDNLKAFWIS